MALSTSSCNASWMPASWRSRRFVAVAPPHQVSVAWFSCRLLGPLLIAHPRFWASLVISPTYDHLICRSPLLPASSALYDGVAASSANRNAGKGRIFSAAVVAGLYPNVIRVKVPDQLMQATIHGAVAVDNDPKSIKYFLHESQGWFDVVPGLAGTSLLLPSPS